MTTEAGQIEVLRVPPPAAAKTQIVLTAERRPETMEKEEKITLVRITVSAALTVALMIISPEPQLLKFLLYLIPYFLIGYDVLFSAVKNIFHGELFDEKFLMTIATIGAFAIGDYPEGIAVMVFYQLGEMLQDMAVEKSKKSVEELMDVRPDSAKLLVEGKLQTVSPESVKVGDIIVTDPGEKIPLDGVVIDGSATVDTKSITGEGMPRDVSVGDNVAAGCINLNGSLNIKVTHEYADSTVAKMLELVNRSAERKAKSENFITSFSKVYTPIVVIAALLVAFVPLIFGADFATWLNRALVFLVVSCPCALVISVPLAYFAGIGSSSKKGILVKGSDALEKLSDVSCAVFDKTGTITKGNFVVSAVHPSECSEDELLSYAAAAEAHSNHPVSAALRDKWNNDENYSVSDIEELAGMGVKAMINGKTVAVGNGRLMDSVGAVWHNCHKNGTVVHVAVDGEYAGHIVISDEVKPTAQEALALLKKAGVSKTVILTGDNAATAEEVAKKVGADEVYSSLLPADKVAKLDELMGGTDGKVIFVGDGINDAPVLKLADVGIAMGALGSDAAVESADAVVMDDDLKKLPSIIKIAKKTRRIVTENIVFSLFVKLLIMVLSVAGVPYMMWAAVFGDVGVSLLAVANSLRLLSTKTID